MSTALPAMTASLEHIADLPLYNTEKPYFLAQIPGYDYAESSNLQYQMHNNIPIFDVRGHETEFNLEKNSFTFQKIHAIPTCGTDNDRLSAYGSWVAKYVETMFAADRVICYDIRVSIINLPNRHSVFA